MNFCRSGLVELALAYAYYHTNDILQAIRYTLRVLTYNQKNMDAIAFLIFLYIKVNQYDNIRLFLKKLKELDELLYLFMDSYCKMSDNTLETKNQIKFEKYDKIY